MVKITGAIISDEQLPALLVYQINDTRETVFQFDNERYTSLRRTKNTIDCAFRYQLCVFLGRRKRRRIDNAGGRNLLPAASGIKLSGGTRAHSLNEMRHGERS
jgi:hypothetical protein